MSVRKASESLNSSCGRRMCSKHPERLATHYCTSNAVTADTFYCQKCSIMLASQGFNVVKIASINASHPKKMTVKNKTDRKLHPAISNRKHEIAIFVEGLESLYQNLERIMDGVQDYLIKSENEHGRLIEEASAFYKALEEIIQLQKFTTYNSILSKRSIDEAEVRGSRNIINEAMEEVKGMLSDIRDNMEAVESVDYSIYTTIMGGYQNKIDKARLATKEIDSLKPIEKCTIVLPEIPMALYTLSDRISVIFANKQNSVHNSNKNNNNNSYMGGFKQQMVVSEEDACMFEQSSSEEEFAREDYQLSHQIAETSKSENQPPPNHKQLNPTKNQKKIKELAFSFDSNPNNYKQMKLENDEEATDNFKHLMIKGFEDGKLSKIEERMNSKEVYESRESLGSYLNISNSRNEHSIEDTETLLIV